VPAFWGIDIGVDDTIITLPNKDFACKALALESILNISIAVILQRRIQTIEKSKDVENEVSLAFISE